mgnify:CR=1 FL=1
MEKYTGTVLTIDDHLGRLYCEDLETEFEFENNNLPLENGDRVQFRLIMVAYVNQRVAIDVVRISD